MSIYSAEVERLDLIVDRLGEVTQAIVAAAGVKTQKLKRQLRPRTAKDRVSATSALAAHRKLVARVLPDGDAA